MSNVRKATIDDLEQLAVLFDEYRMFYKKNSDTHGAKNFLKERIENNQSEIFVADFNGRLVGFTQLFPLFSSTKMQNYWLLNDLFVNEKYRGKGFSKQLIEKAQMLCKSNAACGILLETDKNNDIGNKLYPQPVSKCTRTPISTSGPTPMPNGKNN